MRGSSYYINYRVLKVSLENVMGECIKVLKIKGRGCVEGRWEGGEGARWAKTCV